MFQKHRFALVLFALMYPTLAAAQEATDPEEAVAPTEPDEALGPPPAEAPSEREGSADARAARVVRIGASGGVGFVVDELPAGTTEWGMARVSVDVLAADPVILGLSAELQRYGRSYATPRAQTGVPVTETRLRYGFIVGLDVMNLAGERDPVFEVVPRLRVTLDTFLNDVFPQNALAIGGDLAIAVHPDERLSLTAEWSYSGVATLTEADVTARLFAGALLAEMRWSGGASWGATDQLRLTAAYEGEWLAYDHSSRFPHALVLGFLVSL
jgi:hypothetical protein